MFFSRTKLRTEFILKLKPLDSNDSIILHVQTAKCLLNIAQTYQHAERLKREILCM
jgi:hypothetical protein